MAANGRAEFRGRKSILSDNFLKRHHLERVVPFLRFAVAGSRAWVGEAFGILCQSCLTVLSGKRV